MKGNARTQKWTKIAILTELVVFNLLLAFWIGYGRGQETGPLFGLRPGISLGDEETGSAKGSDTELTKTETPTETQTKPANTQKPSNPSDPAIEPDTDPQVRPRPVTSNVNPLTGIYDLSEAAVGKRPVAVMINNVKKSFPQYGVADADLIFEIPVEGFLTRFMAVYADYTLMPRICSIRSCRPYFPAIAKGFDAVYVYSGMDSGIRSYVKSLELTEFEGSRNHGNLFGRDQSRLDAGYKLEHTLYFDGTGIAKAMEKRKLRTNLLSAKRGEVFSFRNGSEHISVDRGTECAKAVIDFGATTAMVV